MNPEAIPARLSNTCTRVNVAVVMPRIMMNSFSERRVGMTTFRLALKMRNCISEDPSASKEWSRTPDGRDSSLSPYPNKADDQEFRGRGPILFVIRNAKHSAENFALASWTMLSTLRGERSGSERLPELR